MLGSLYLAMGLTRPYVQARKSQSRLTMARMPTAAKMPLQDSGYAEGTLAGDFKAAIAASKAQIQPPTSEEEERIQMQRSKVASKRTVAQETAATRLRKLQFEDDTQKALHLSKVLLNTALCLSLIHI